MRFRKKPVVIEAEMYRSGRTLSSDMAMPEGTFKYTEAGTLLIQTLEGTMEARDGDWVIKGVKGEFYPCKPDIFKATYEAVDDCAPDPMRVGPGEDE